MNRARAHFRRSAPETGLYACIFFAYGKKGYRFNPLRCCKTASLPACLRQTPFLEREAWSFAMQNSEVICKANYPASLPACLRQGSGG
jgi:hypothetical protein